MHFHHIFIFSKVHRTSDINSPTFYTWSLDVGILHINPYDVGTTYIGSSQILITQKIKNECHFAKYYKYSIWV
jgi:hypothetical protein